MRSTRTNQLARVIIGLVGAVVLTATPARAQDPMYKPLPEFEGVRRAMARLESEGDRLPRDTRAALLAEGQAILAYQRMFYEGRAPIQREAKDLAARIRAFNAQSTRTKEEANRLNEEIRRLNVRGDAVNARASARYAAFARAVEGAFRLPRQLISVDRARPLNAPVTSTRGHRDADSLRRVIDQFRVEQNPRYLPGDKTYCNVFAMDVMHGLGVELPRNTLANDVIKWLNDKDGGVKGGWRKVGAQEAQANANAGRPSLACWRNPNPKDHGHIAVLRPGVAGAHGPAIAQAGRSNANSTHVKSKHAFGTHTVEYWIHE